jgi:photosystem II stability/assembly factor-like uncharacterized protein
VDGGENWEVASRDLWNAGVQVLAIDPLTPSTLYAGGNGLFMSDNGGVDWVVVNSSSLSAGIIDIYSIAIDPVTPTTLYIGTWDGYTPSGGSIYKSTDGGWSLREINSDLPTAIVYSIAIDPMNPANVYIGTAKGLFKSTNGGEDWSEVDPGLSDAIVTALVLDPFIPTTLFAGAWDHGVFVYHQVEEK